MFLSCRHNKRPTKGQIHYLIKLPRAWEITKCQNGMLCLSPCSQRVSLFPGTVPPCQGRQCVPLYLWFCVISSAIRLSPGRLLFVCGCVTFFFPKQTVSVPSAWAPQDLGSDLAAGGTSRPENTRALPLTPSLCELSGRFLSDRLTCFQTGTPVIW